jgi:tripartite-type tricarboxylate transporter receptor subunit TctC
MTVAVAAGAYAAKGYPKRNITAVVVWGAGGGTDTCNRIIHAEMANFWASTSTSSTRPAVWRAPWA